MGDRDLFNPNVMRDNMHDQRADGESARGQGISRPIRICAQWARGWGGEATDAGRGALICVAWGCGVRGEELMRGADKGICSAAEDE